MSKTIRIKSITLNYEVIGEGQIILFLHGYSLHLDSLKYSAEAILKDSNYKRIYVDLPGMGKSTYDDSIQNTDDILDIILGFIKEIIKDEPFAVAGHSYGGYLARGLVAKLPNQVLGMAMFCPVIKANFKDRILPPSKVAYEDTEYLNTLSDEEREGLGFIVFRSKHVIERTRKEFFANRPDNEEYLERIQKYGYAFKNDVDQEIGRYEKPVLFLLGKHDNITGYEDAFPILKHYPNSSCVVLDDAGHNLFIEQEELFNLHMKKWLDRIKRK